MSEDGTRSLPADSQVAELSELENISSQAAYETFLLPAKAVEASAIEECRADIPFTYFIVTRSVENVLGSATVVVGKLPSVNLEELSALPRLAQGLAFAALQVHREARAAPFGALFERATHLRRKLSAAAGALADANLLPAVDVEEARLHVRLDVVEESLALAALFQRHLSLVEGRSPVNKTDLLEVEQVAKKLRTLLGRPAPEGEEGSVPALVKAIEMRDRLWTLLTRRHDMLWRCGAWLYGRAVDERVPPLPTRDVGNRRSPFAQERAAPRMLVPGGAPSGASTYEMPRQRSELEQRTRFLIRFGVIPPSR